MHFVHTATLLGAPFTGLHLVDVRVPATARASVGVGDVVPESRLLPADIADGWHGPERVPKP